MCTSVTIQRLGSPIWMAGEADAVCGVHRLHHVVEERAHLIVDDVDGRGVRLQPLVGRGDDRAYGHRYEA